MKEYDLSRDMGCRDNPISKLLKLMDEEQGEFIVLIKKTTLPLEIAKIIATRKHYVVELIDQSSDELRIKFKRIK
ncbi:MAG: hypothetical protein QXE10_03620 [Desulfurococcaceae archaeon]|jgi:hypothetical protein